MNARSEMPPAVLPSKGRLFLLTGLSGSGKGTLGHLLVTHLNQHGVRPAFLLDGDAARVFFGGDLSFSPSDRDGMTRRMAFAARTLVDNGIDVVMANIAGAKATRDFLREKFADYIEVHLDVDLQTLIDHDVKGVYKKHLAQEHPMMVGVDIPYERPEVPDVVVYPYKESPEQSLKRILDCLVHRGPVMGTKADTLESIACMVKRSSVLPQVVLSWNLIGRDPANHFRRIQDSLGKEPYVVRSSCRNEDSKRTSNAGTFVSILDVAPDQESFVDAAKRVRDSYIEKGVEKADSEQILIQAMLQSVRVSGVVCTRYRAKDSPYYVVNYDDQSGKTTAVTSGTGGKVVFVSRFIRREDLGRWLKVIEAIRELEQLFPKFPLEVEFAVTHEEDVVILQCRPLVVTSPHVSLEESAGELIQELKLRFDRCQLPQPHLPGTGTVLSDMADWNPSEIIGDRPSTLSYSMYRELVSDRTWHEARTSQGYYDILHGNLMISMARKPYIDTQMSFASLTPASLDHDTREKLVNVYVERLKANRHLHDKIEFEIAFTCFDLTAEERMRARGGLTEAQIQRVLETLKELTNRLVVRSAQDIQNDFMELAKLEKHLQRVKDAYREKAQYWDCFSAAFLLFEPLRLLGVLPFARLARLAFIGRSLLSSLVCRGLLTEESCSLYLRSIPTVATECAESLTLLRAGRMKREEFLQRFGHLRMNTYDITSPRYDQIPAAFWDAGSAAAVHAEAKEHRGLEELTAIDGALRSAGVAFNGHELLEFVRASTQARENAKFRFTRVLSEAMEYLARGGALLGLTRDDLQYITLPVLLRFRNPEFGSPARASQYLRQRMGEKARERSVFDLIKLPPVIADGRDIELVEFEEAKPNFVSSKCVTGSIVRLTPQAESPAADLAGKIVVIENADPGFDWIFSASIAGLVTKYGGVASHMAIRCAEFDLPGAIGCGEVIFNRLLDANSVRLDCRAEVIHIV